ncbi:adenylate cyclase [Aureococcus anophagefferens]|nr:adenylate cyclase [Aureococcus anophagefferens]
MSQKEWNTTEIGASRVGKFARFRPDAGDHVAPHRHSLAHRADAMVLSRNTRRDGPRAAPAAPPDLLRVVVRVEAARNLLNRDVYALPHSVAYALALGGARRRSARPVLGKAAITWAEEHAFLAERADVDDGAGTERFNFAST